MLTGGLLIARSHFFLIPTVLMTLLFCRSTLEIAAEYRGIRLAGGASRGLAVVLVLFVIAYTPVIVLDGLLVFYWISINLSD